MTQSRRDLASLTCIPCRGGIPPLTPDKVSRMMNIVSGWNLRKGPERIEKLYKFRDFAESMAFVNRVADIAEEQDHHPDILIHWNEVTLTLWTHAINGLHDNDFIVAAKIDKMMKES